MARPLIIAHRGASTYAPENTRAAFELARKMGADGFECDVRLSKDGVPVVIHDDKLKRLAGVNARVGDLTLRALKKLDVGSWYDRRFAQERILTLEETLALARPRFIAMVELKAVRDARRNLRLALEAARLLDEAVAKACSFSADVCLALKAALPDLHVELVAQAPSARRWQSLLAAARGFNGISLDYRHLSAERIRHARETGLCVSAWTVNRASSVARVARLGVDAIETDRPDMALAASAAAGDAA